MTKPNTGALGRIEGKVDVLTVMVSDQNKRIDSKVGWAPFGVFIAFIAAAISAMIPQTFKGN